MHQKLSPLWYFNIQDGIWKEDGEATLQGNKYIGNVSHFTTWNVDWFEDPVTIFGHILDCDGYPISGISIKVENKNGAFIGYTFTDSNGYYEALIPEGVDLTLIAANQKGCNSFSSNIGSFNSNTTVNNISICNSNNPILIGYISNNCSNVNYAAIIFFDLATDRFLGSSYEHDN